ncbi:MAG: NAD(P)-binding protein, partial [Candidatus Nanoarchaeia archaeon]|nr:NAD(P)-binding protein [Candidatus Nanoarchaeia archaeon]
MEKYDIIVIGSEITGLSIANIYANKGKKVLILEKNNHI